MVAERLEALAADGDRSVFVDPDEYRRFVERKERQFRDELTRQRSSGTAGGAIK